MKKVDAKRFEAQENTITTYREKNGRWQIEWTDTDGNDWTTGFGVGFSSKEDALEWLRTGHDNGKVISKTKQEAR